MAFFYDTHAHLDYPDYANELPAALERAHAAGVTRIISVGTSLASSERAIALAERFPQIYAAVGWQPSETDEAPEDLRPALRELAKHPKVVAIGETGLDHHWLPSKTNHGTPEDDARAIATQVRAFRQQLEVAAEFGLNVIVHERECFEAVLAELVPFVGRVRAVFHCFVSDVATLNRVMAIGSWVSFTGILTFKNGQTVRDSLAAAPAGRFMLETDSPYLAPVPYRGKRCEPAFLQATAEVAARARGCSMDELSEATCRAAREFFPKLG